MYISNALYVQDLKRVLEMDLSFLKGKNFFITGASGMVGSFLIDILMQFNRENNEKINIYATFISDKDLKNRFPSYINDPYFHSVILDITTPINLDIKPDYILHAASLTHPKAYAEKPVETMKINMLGTINVLDWARKNPACRILFLSTMEVYGENPSQNGIFKETDIGTFDFTTVRACSPESKRVCETLTRCYAKEYNIQVMTARLGYVYGPSVQLNSSKADVQFLNNALRNENIVMKSAGTQKRSYCYVGDIVSGILTILKNGMSGEAYNIANKMGNVSLRDVAEALAELAKVKVIFENPTDAEKQGYSTVQNSTLDATKLESLGWHPRFSLREGIKHTFEIKKVSL